MNDEEFYRVILNQPTLCIARDEEYIEVPSLNSASLNYSNTVSYNFNSKSPTIEDLKKLLKPVRVIFNDPVTVVYWSDDTKTLVRCSENEEFIPEFGLAMAFMRKLYPNRGEFLQFLEDASYQEKRVKKAKEENVEVVAEDTETAVEYPEVTVEYVEISSDMSTEVESDEVVSDTDVVENG
jgi:hypothetical protein